ncbi:MAG: methyltransferase domain-containing protein [Candidatus Sulfotelmatobacter sp.]
MQLSFPLIRGQADDDNADSLANRLRNRRFQLFEAFAARLPRPLNILDVGGTNAFWEQRGWAGRHDVRITTLNLEAEPRRFDNVEPAVGDATDLAQFGDRSFDIVFSNSVIEHLFSLENQRKMASEVQRVGKAYWVQTPNFWFPVEPHFHVPAWQWLPVGARVALIRRWRCGWRGPCPDPARAKELVSEVRLLTRSEIVAIFPGARLIPERIGGLVKSWTAVGEFQLQEKN